MPYIYFQKISGSIPVLRALFVDTERVFTNQPHVFYAASTGLYGVIPPEKKNTKKSTAPGKPHKTEKRKGKRTGGDKNQGPTSLEKESPAEEERESSTKDQEAQAKPEVAVTQIQTAGAEDMSYNIHIVCYPVRYYYRIGSGQTDSRNTLSRGCLTRNVISSLPNLYGGQIEFDEL